MARKSKEQTLSEIHQEALKEFDAIQGALRDERKQCLEDRRFYSIAGAQWEGKLGEQFANKPMVEVNKVHLAVIRIINEYLNNKISVSFADKVGDQKMQSLADVCALLYRADEQDSSADEAYDNAFEEAVGGGYGAFRLRTEYEDESDAEDDRQRIRIEPIFDADSCVFFDLGAKRQDKADAKRCYVLTAMTHDAFREEFEEDPSSFPKSISNAEFDWFTPDLVYIAEYYRVVETTETVYTFTGLDGQERKVSEEELEEIEEELYATGFRETRQRKIKRKRVHKYLLSGNSILEDCGLIAGSCIPVIPVYGKRWFIDGVERCMGHVRLAKDVQRLKNMQLSKLAEISALSSVEKPIFAAEQVRNHQAAWADDHLKNYPFLLADPITNLQGDIVQTGPVAYTKAPQIPPAMAALLQLTEQDMSDILGNQQGADKVVSNISGKAVDMIQQRLDMQAFIYMSNMAKAIQRAGEVWLSMARDVFVEKGRKLKGVTNQGQVESIELLRPVVNESGAMDYDNDLSRASFDVVVDVGPSSQSRRAATVRALTGMMQLTQDPETINVLTAMAMMNMEGEGVQEVRDWYRSKLIKMGVVKPTEQEQKELMAELENMPPDPNTVFLEASAEQAKAEAAKSRASAVLSLAKTEETKAKTAETLSNIDIGKQKQLLETVSMLGDAVTSGENPAASRAQIGATTQPQFMGE
jgi:hypothetical protein